jgi:hypothetical protein
LPDSNRKSATLKVVMEDMPLFFDPYLLAWLLFSIFACFKHTYMTISTNELILAGAIAVLLAGALAFLLWKQRKEANQVVKQPTPTPSQPIAPTKQLQLQAYERLILLTDRIAIPNLVNRVNQQGLSAREMQMLLTLAIRQEFEHNITQQLYVSPEAWDALRNYKEQNLLIINQIANILPEHAAGIDLNKKLLEFIVENPKASLQNIVADALSFEAKKLMNP